MLDDWSCIQGTGVEAHKRRHAGTIPVDKVLKEEPKRNIDATLYMGQRNFKVGMCLRNVEGHFIKTYLFNGLHHQLK